MIRQVIAQTLITRQVRDLDELFRLLVDNDQPIYIVRDDVRGVLLPQQTYRALRERLEELEELGDLLAMREAEAEYQAGDKRSFDDIVAELEIEDSSKDPSDVSN